MKRFLSIFLTVLLVISAFPQFGGIEKAYADTPDPIAVMVELNSFTAGNVGGDGADTLLWKKGDSSLSGGQLRLTDSSWQAGSVVKRNQVKLTDGFSTYFQMYFSGDADGIAFILYKADAPKLGENGGALGYGDKEFDYYGSDAAILDGIDKSIHDSIIVEFDTWKNYGVNADQYDLNDAGYNNHVAIMLDGNQAHNLQSDGGAAVYTSAGLSGQTINAWVDYESGNGTDTTGTVTVTFGTGTTKADAANDTISRTIQVTDDTPIAGDNVFIGFTSSTGGNATTHKLLKWYFKDTYVADGLDPAAGTYSQAPSTVGITLDQEFNPSQATIRINDASGAALADQAFDLYIDNVQQTASAPDTFTTDSDAPNTYTYSIPEDIRDGSHTLRVVAAGGATNFVQWADLSDLTLSSGTLSPNFSSAATAYTATVENSVSSITVTPAIEDANATVTVNGTAVPSGDASENINLNIGDNTITVAVKEPDGATTKSYTITVTRLFSASVSATCTTAAAVSWDSVAGATDYKITVATDDNFVNKVDGYDQRSVGTAATNHTVTGLTANTAYYAIVQATNASAQVFSSDILTLNTLPVGSPIAITVELNQFSGTNVGGDDANTLLWKKGHANTIDGKLRVVPEANTQAGTVVRRNQIRLTDGFSTYFQFNLNKSSGTNYADGLSFMIYEADEPQVGASGEGLGYKGIGTSIAIEFDIYRNTANNVNDPDNRHAAIMLNGDNTHGPGAATQPTVNYPNLAGNTINVWVDYNGGVVTATFGTGSYRNHSDNRTMTRNVGTFLEGKDIFVGFSAATGADKANHDILKWHFKDSYVAGGLCPAEGTYAQAASTIDVELDQTTNPSTAGISVRGASGTIMNNQTIEIFIDDASKGTFDTGAAGTYTYTLPNDLSYADHVIRAIAVGGATNFKGFTVVVFANADLTDLSLSSGTLSPVFASGTTSYSAAVGNAVTSITVTPTVSDANATVTVNGSAVASGEASDDIALDVGDNTITTLVTAQDTTTTKTYTTTVTREASANADLSDLSLSSGTLRPIFAAGTTSYSAAVGYGVRSITVTPTVSDANASVTVNASAVASGEASDNIALNVGANTITVEVTAQNATSKTYILTVTRADDSSDDSSGGSSSPSSTPSSTPIQGSVIDNLSGQPVESVPAQVTTEPDGTQTVSMKITETILEKKPDGTRPVFSKLDNVSFTTAEGTTATIAVKPDGTIEVKNLEPGTQSQFAIIFDLGNGRQIQIGTIEVKVDSSGQVSLTSTLIDPYGIITDSRTNEPIMGADVKLYFADTLRNRENGNIPDSLVSLPILAGFKPNDNANPQASDAYGAYAYMVFPTSDYYLLATKDGYERYKSPTISVEQDIVKWDFKMHEPVSGVQRLFGPNRVDTAIAIAQANYPGKVANVVLATADNYPDALTGSVLAYKLNAPLLLVGSSSSDQNKVFAYMKQSLKPEGTVYILGGQGAVGAAVEEKIKASGFARITRLGGSDRYETALKIAEKLEVEKGRPVVLVYGENYPDALSVSSAAAAIQSPILLVQKNGISEAVKKKIAEIKPVKVYIIGLEGVISQEAENQAAQITALDKKNIIRIGGADRYQTSLAVAQYFNLAGRNISVATGQNFPDALAGSVYAANFNAPILLLNNSIPEDVLAYLRTRDMTGAAIFGGEAILKAEIAAKLRALIQE